MSQSELVESSAVGSRKLFQSESASGLKSPTVGMVVSASAAKSASCLSITPCSVLVASTPSAVTVHGSTSTAASFVSRAPIFQSRRQ